MLNEGGKSGRGEKFEPLISGAGSSIRLLQTPVTVPRRLNESFATETLCVPKTSFHVNVAGRETIMSAMQLGFEL